MAISTTRSQPAMKWQRRHWRQRLDLAIVTLISGILSLLLFWSPMP